MTRLHYLQARNKRKRDLISLPAHVIRVLRAAKPHVDMLRDAEGAREAGYWGPRRSLPECDLAPSAAYRIKDTLRPSGIPEDIHRRYS